MNSDTSRSVIGERGARKLGADALEVDADQDTAALAPLSMEEAACATSCGIPKFGSNRAVWHRGSCQAIGD